MELEVTESHVKERKEWEAAQGQTKEREDSTMDHSEKWEGTRLMPSHFTSIHYLLSVPSHFFTMIYYSVYTLTLMPSHFFAMICYQCIH